jgi:hypothetical protein
MENLKAIENVGLSLSVFKFLAIAIVIITLASVLFSFLITIKHALISRIWQSRLSEVFMVLAGLTIVFSAGIIFLAQDQGFYPAVTFVLSIFIISPSKLE